MQFDFTRLGLRVPAVLVSPWIQKGVIDSTRYQHTSIFATLRDLFGVGTLTKRDAEAASFASLLRKLNTPRTDAPLKLTRPQLPPVNPADMQKPLTDRQKDLWPMLAQLDGYPDSGKVTTPPATRAAAADYIQERIRAHELFHRERRRRARYNIQPTAKGKFGWRFHDENGRVLATSAKTYSTPMQAQRDIERIRDLAPFARQTGPARSAGVARKQKRKFAR